MFAGKKAHYNLLRLDDPNDSCWETRDYRALEPSEIIEELAGFGLAIESIEQFEQSADEYDAPEEMGETFFAEAEEPDKAFLLLFELWRRYLPEKRSVSTFCDELDHQISLYYEKGSSQETYDIIGYLKQICDDNADSGVEATDILSSLQHASCQDIEAFLYDYTLEQIDEDEIDYAGELVEGFYPYIVYPAWFDYLVARLEMTHDLKVGYKRLNSVIGNVQDVDFALEILNFLAETGDSLFPKLAHRTLDLLETEADLIDLLECCSRFFDQDDFEKRIARRKKKDPTAPLKPKDVEMKRLREFFSAHN